MRRAALASIAVWIGACGTQDLKFDVPDAMPDVVSSMQPSEDGGLCKTKDDCHLAGLYCTTAGQCVACLTDDQCATFGNHCDPSLNLCVECRVGVESDCPGGWVCEPTTHRCILPCGDGGACPNDRPLCNNTGVCSECLSDAYCQGSRSPQYCDPTIGQCVNCRLSEDCPPEDDICNPTTGRCVQCLNSAGCPAGVPCDPYDHKCRTMPADSGPPPGGPAPDAGRTPL